MKMRKKKLIARKARSSSEWYDYFFKPFPIVDISKAESVQAYLDHIPKFLQQVRESYAS